MIQLSSKNDESSPCYDASKIIKLTNLVIFRAISIITVGQTYILRDVIIIILTIKTRLMCIYIYICNELIEETAREYFGYGSSKF